MPIQTVKAKMLLGWMKKHEAVTALNACIFDEPLNKKKTVALWKEYRDKVAALEPRDPGLLTVPPLTDVEKQAVEGHIRRIRGGPNGQYLSEVTKVEVGNLIAR